MAKIIWIIIGLIGSEITNEILYNIFNSRNSGVNRTNAALPALGAAIVLIYCFYQAFSGKSIYGIAAKRMGAHKTIAAKKNSKNNLTLYPKKNDEELWETAIEEYDSPMRKKGLYAKIYSQKNGNESLVKAEYIKERFEKLKEEEIERRKEKNKIESEYNKNQGAENSIKSGRYTLKQVKGVDCLFFENGQAAIKVNERKYRLYEDDESLEKSIKYFASSNMYLTTGLIQVIEINNGFEIISCPRCKQKTRVPSNKELQITCPSCKFEWVEKT